MHLSACLIQHLDAIQTQTSNIPSLRATRLREQENGGKVAYGFCILLVQCDGNEEEMEWDMGVDTWGLMLGHVDEVLGPLKGKWSWTLKPSIVKSIQRLASNILGLDFVTCPRRCLNSSLLDWLLLPRFTADSIASSSPRNHLHKLLRSAATSFPFLSLDFFQTCNILP